MYIYKKYGMNRFSLGTILERCSAFFLAGVYLYGGIPKLLDTKSFADIIAAYGIVPDSFVFATALILPVIEVITAVGLLLKKYWASVSALLLLLMFISILSYGIYLGLDIDCGCFGPEDPEHVAFSGLRSALIRDLFFLIPACYLLLFNSTKVKQLFERRKV